jgi:polyphosphate kinase 2 (PPK2 family)
MENNTTQKTVAEIRDEIDDIRSKMCGKFVYVGMFDRSYFNLFTKEELVERLVGIANESKHLEDQYRQKINEMLNAKS